MELAQGELYREIKRKFYSGRKDDPITSTRVEVRIDQDVFDGGIATEGKPKNERGKAVYRFFFIIRLLVMMPRIPFS